jgi:hypothetical protein
VVIEVTPAPTATPTIAAPPSPTPLVDAFVSPLSPLAITEESGLLLGGGREQGALAGYAAAEAAARQWSADAYFVGIVPSILGARALPSYPTEAGWIYRFARAADTRELFVQVVNGEVGLSGEAEALRPDGERPQPVDAATVKLDSGDARQLYAERLSDGEANDDYLDYALEFDPQSGRILWFVYDRARSWGAVLTVDAVTGEVLP